MADAVWAGLVSALRWFSSAQQRQKSLDVMGQSGQDPHTIELAVAVMVLAKLGVAGSVPGVFDRPPVADMLQQRLGCGAQTRDVVEKKGRCACGSRAAP